jgi:hypothetical protein
MSAAEVNLAAKNMANSFHRYKLMSDSGYRKYYARELIGDVFNRLKLYQKAHRD